MKLFRHRFNNSTETVTTTTVKKRPKKYALLQLSGPIYQSVIESTRTHKTRINYISKLRGFCQYLKLPGNEVDRILFDGDVKLIQNTVIDFIKYLKTEKGIESSLTLQSYIIGVRYFYDNALEMPLQINWRKVYRFIGEHQRKVVDLRPYTREEIAKLLEVASDDRERLIVLLMCSTGMRKGALPGLRIGDIKRIPEPNSLPKIYEIIVYRGFKSEYICFMTPETSETLEKYLEFRRRFGEKEMTSKTPLIRNSFDISDSSRIRAAHPRKIKGGVIENIMLKLAYKAGLREKKNTGEQNVIAPKVMYEASACHSLRRFFDTECTKAGMKLINIELLMGHKTGLKHCYYKPKKSDLIEDYMKAVDALTISPEYKLRTRVNTLELEKKELEGWREFGIRMDKRINELYERLGLVDR
jgi:integrase